MEIIKEKYEWQVIEIGNGIHDQEWLQSQLNEGWEPVTTAPYVKDGTTEYVEYTLRRQL